jgi:hypothetical protein
MPKPQKRVRQYNKWADNIAVYVVACFQKLFQIYETVGRNLEQIITTEVTALRNT